MSNCVAGYAERCVKGISQIWSVRLRDGTRLSTLETRIQTCAKGRKALAVEQHKGVRNGTPPALACQAVHEHVAGFSVAQEQMNTYLNWKQTIPRQPLKARQRHALMQPVVTALEQTLSGKWSWPHLVAALSIDFPKGLQCVPGRH